MSARPLSSPDFCAFLIFESIGHLLPGADMEVLGKGGIHLGHAHG